MPDVWQSLRAAVSAATETAPQTVLATGTMVIAALVILTRGVLLDRLRYREESTRAAVRSLNELLVALEQLSQAVYVIADELLLKAHRHSVISRVVERASRHRATWSRNGYLIEIAASRTRFPLGSRGVDHAASRGELEEAMTRVSAVLDDIAREGVRPAVQRLLAPVMTEAFDLGILTGSPEVRVGRFDLGTVIDRPLWENRIVEVLSHEFSLLGGDCSDDKKSDYVMRSIHRYCIEAARSLDSQAQEYLFASRRIQILRSHLRRRQGGEGWTVQIATELTK
ncbi:hypothetical protein GCM10012275_62540 [Longimycelium tulufanense]|uniref:Uncharacterized protein n=1 Tax=Longimycelium tulufanense TaxID=907463 RepID=A0A8J3FX52_9PSEU|nr:hypothetical protein GCM10012275_62540 [Longimycelium tulufanense]